MTKLKAPGPTIHLPNLLDKGCEYHRPSCFTVTVLLSGTAVVALVLAFRVGMGLMGIHQVLRSEGEEVAVALMAVLFLSLPFLGMVAVAPVAVRSRTGRRDR